MKKLKKLLPGLIFTAILAWIAIGIENVPFVERLHLNSLIIAILMGVVIRNLIKIPASFEPGIHFSLKRVLKLAIILLGFKLSFTQVAEIGGKGLLQVSIVSTCTMFFSYWVGKKLNLSDELSLLIGTGSSICGTSAVAAIGPIIKAEERDTGFAIAAVTIFGTLAMFLYPVLFRFLHLPQMVYAVWSGSSIHGVGQAVAAGFAAGEMPGQFATLVKLTRVLLLIPVALILSYRQVKKDKLTTGNEMQSIAIPWFVFLFLAMVIINSINIVPTKVVGGIVEVNSFLLTLAMVGLGMKTSLAKIKEVGIKPFYAGFLTWVFIGTLSFIVSKILFI